MADKARLVAEMDCILFTKSLLHIFISCGGNAAIFLCFYFVQLFKKFCSKNTLRKCIQFAQLKYLEAYS